MSHPPLTICLFGPLRISVSGEPLPRVRTRSVEWLLALLTLRHSRSVSRAWLAGTLWPDSSESRALQNLREDLVRLRKALGPEAARIQSPARDLLTLDLAGAEVDVLRFDQGVQAEDEASLRTAVGLYTGPLLEGCVEEWVLLERETRAEQCLRALEALAERAEARGEHSEALASLRRAEALDPLRDSLQRGLIRLLAAGGDLPAALLTYREHRLRLHREMNLEPDGETQTLFRRLREEARRQASGRGSEGERERGSFGRERESEGAREREKEGRTPSSDPSLAPSLPRSLAPSQSSLSPSLPLSLSPSAARLPTPITALLGREQEVREIAARIPASRLVTLVGGGGVGKTRLALQVAAGLAEEYPGRVLFVELAPLAAPALLPAFVAGTLGLPEAAGSGPASGMAALIRWLAWEPTLLVLDNCEHLVLAVAELAQALLQACPGLRLLATSRQRLGLTGEVVWRVPSLPAPDPEQLPGEAVSAVEHVLQFPAAQLWVERAAMARPGFRLRSREEALAVARICQRLDGVPLALELAAARVTVLPVAQIAARLDDRFQLLTGGSRSVLPRHRTLRALIDWSYDSLPAPEAALLRRLSVFAGGWTLAGAEAVCSDPEGRRQKAEGSPDGEPRESADDQAESLLPSAFCLLPSPPSLLPSAYCLLPSDALDLLDSLEACSLVLVDEAEEARFDAAGVSAGGRAPGEGLRYRMLETVREYAREKLRACGEDGLARAAHAAYCLELAETAEAALRGPEQLVWLDLLETEHANLRAALDWCLADGIEIGLRLARAMHSLWVTRPYYGKEGRQYLELLLASPPAAGRMAARAEALSNSAALAYIHSDYPAARAQAQESLAIFEELDDRRGIARALLFLSTLTSDGEEARRLVTRSLAVSRGCNDAAGVAGALARLASSAQRTQEYDTARALHQEALAMARSSGDRMLEAVCLAGLGGFEWSRREYAAARDHFQDSLTLARELGMLNQTAVALYRLGGLAFQEGDYAAAQALWEECREVDRRNRNKGGAVLGRLAELATLKGDTATARARWEESLAEGRELGRLEHVAYALLGLGEVARLEGDGAGALTRYAESLQTIHAALRPENRIADHRHEDICALCLRGIAAVLRRSGREEPAARLLGAAGALVEAIGMVLSASAQADYEEQIAALRAAMREEAFAAAWAEGRAMAPEQAVQYALDAVCTG
jgi:predicted ATPase/DNA-binding SARP family transcriptional activator